MKRVFLDRFDSPEDLSGTIARALHWIRASELIGRDTRVFIKPNLTWRRPTPGVTVTPEFIRTVVEHLLPLTPHITIGEAEGGQASFSADEAFETHGLHALAKDHGIQVVNLSRGRHERATTTVCGEEITVELPSLLLHEVDLFITLPVPKMHAMTRMSLGLKNQWGCLGDKMRVTQHPRFDKAIVAINKLVKTKICIFDGTYFLDHTGPMMGDAVRMNIVIAGDDPGAASYAACEVMRVDPFRVSHHVVARREGLFPGSLAEIELNRAPSELAGRKFRLRRAFINYIHLAAFRTRPINRFFYDSIFANAMHEALWFIRRQPLVHRLLYGKFGSGEAKRGGAGDPKSDIRL
ncbi:MAG TPA: DUF362 domain-containing protein [Vicinamibacterales bacterium]|nr:DUF362 domain-containing protein [Vicinamibacterales bacterium]